MVCRVAVFCRSGALGVGGITLGSLLKAEAIAGEKATRKSLINIYLGGGPTHLDTFDLKPLAPKEFRGEFRPIATNAQGVEICELMPHLATVADKYSIIRSITGMNDEHNSKQSESGLAGTGFEIHRRSARRGVRHVQTLGTGSEHPAWNRPDFRGPHWLDRTRILGASPLRLSARWRRPVEFATEPQRHHEPLGRPQGLAQRLDRMRRDADASGMMNALDSFSDRAVGIITSGELAKALDLKYEDPKSVDRYGINDSNNRRRNENQRFLISRRLIEAGVRCVSFSWGGWDTHGQNFRSMRDQLPPLSLALTALIEDLDVLADCSMTPSS